MNEQTVHVVAHLVPKPGQEAALAGAITAIIPAVLTEPGCVAYIAHESRDAPGTIVMVEAWTDDAALVAHMQAPAFRSLEAQFVDLLAQPPVLERLRRI